MRRRLEEDQTKQMCRRASATKAYITRSAEGDVSPSEAWQISLSVCPTTDGSHAVIIIHNRERTEGEKKRPTTVIF